MARPRRLPAVPVHVDPVAHHIAMQAHEALAAGMGMTAFFAWACSYAMGQKGLSQEEAERIILPAWEDAWDHHREREFAAVVS